MEKYLADIFKLVGDAAERIGNMQTSAVLALACLAMGYYIMQIKKHHEEYNEEWQKIRIQEAIADAKMADAISHLADKMDAQQQNTLEIKFILDERLTKGAKNV